MIPKKALDDLFCRRHMPRPNSQIIVGALKERETEREGREGVGGGDLLRESTSF